MRMLRILVLGWLVLGGAILAGATRAPEYPLVGADVFDPVADASTDLAAALAEARGSGRHVLLFLGANWCRWCHRLDALLRSDAALSEALARGYVVVRIDVNWKGLTVRHAELLARYRRPPQRGIPVLTLLDADGRVIAAPDISRWETQEPKDYDVAKLSEFVAANAPR